MSKYKKGSLTRKILEILTEEAKSVVEIADELSDFMAESGFGSGYKGQQTPEEYKKYKQRIERDKDQFNKLQQQRVEKQRLHNLLYKLQKEQLIIKTSNQVRKSLFGITLKGEKKKNILIEKDKSKPKSDWQDSISKNYICQLSKFLTIIIFDIPEKEKHKRNWLRSVIKNLGFKKLQKSVWIGKLILPEEFIFDLKKINILQFVIICSVANEGNILDHINFD